MSFESLLINLCDVSRFTAGAQDAYGNPAKSWANYLTDQPCRLSRPTGKEMQVGAQLVVADAKLFMLDVDVTEQDRIVIGTDTYEILLVNELQDGTAGHHKELYLKRVKD